MRRLLTAVLLALAAFAVEARAQSASPELAAVNTVLDWRLNWSGDVTPFNACAIYEAAGRPENFPVGIQPGLIRGLDRTSEPCSGRDPAQSGAWRREVLVDSIVVNGASATVYVTVSKGEMSYHECYLLVNPSPRVWGLAEVRSWGALREYPARPPAPPGSR
jgi:hypothetical protein